MDVAIGSVSLKTKGFAMYSDTGEVFDTTDLIVPALEHDALFVATALLRTDNQTKGICHGIDNKTEHCSRDSDCHTFWSSSGIQTGQCDLTSNLCLVQTWCPIENDTIYNLRSFTHVNTWTTFMRVNVRFDKFGRSLSNAGLGLVPLVTLWSFDDMLAAAGYTYDQIKTNGSVLLGSIKFDCDFNNGGDSSSKCSPKITFSRIDDPNPASFSTGFNYRTARYYLVPSPDGSGKLVEQRSLFKMPGIRVVFYIYGFAGRFAMLPLMVQIGSGLGLLGIATFVCDLVLEKFWPINRRKYDKVELENLGVHTPLMQKVSTTTDTTPKEVVP